MSEMLIVTPPEKKKVFDYDILFASGMVMPITIDPAVGDELLLGEKIIQVKLNSKPSRNDHTKILPAEDITIFVDKIVSIQKREREVVEQTAEESAEWEKAFKTLAAGGTKH